MGRACLGTARRGCSWSSCRATSARVWSFTRWPPSRGRCSPCGWAGRAPWAGVAWYFGSFVGFHIVLAPFMAMWYMLADRAERWVRGIVEEELIRFDLRSYQGQLQRLLPSMRKPPAEPDEPDA